MKHTKWLLMNANSDGLKRIVTSNFREEIGAVHTEHATLIAAAPELLEQLKVAQKWIEFAKANCGLSQKAGGDWYIDQDNIRKVIAKASSIKEGE